MSGAFVFASFKDQQPVKEIDVKLIPENIRKTLIENGKRQDLARETDNEIDFFPSVKLFTPDAGCTWLLTELLPEEPDIAFGLCDLGMGYPELGTVRLSELSALCGPLGLPVERDLYFKAEKPLSVYAEEARELGHIKT
jgi:hypothetical protein